jgi:enamine deaminase RidA (YjgF/YER057c/UK114 family)
MKRCSVNVPGLEHDNPLPAACRIGSLVMSSGIFPKDPATGTAPPELERQCELLFANVRRVVEAAGGSTADIIKMTLWVKDKSARTFLNREWTAMFPDPQSRPARHTFSYNDIPKGMLVQCEIVAVLAQDS